MSELSHPEDAHEFYKSEQERLKDIGSDRSKIVKEINTIREKLARLETDLAMDRRDSWEIVEDISRQISSLDRLSDAIRDAQG